MVRVDRRRDGSHEILVLTLDRPERRNAVDRETLSTMLTALDDLGDARAIVLTGVPPAFCAGADLSGVDEREFVEVMAQVMGRLIDAPVPVIAAVDGPALGAGIQLAIACDLRVATERSVFAVPAARLGLVLDAVSIERLASEFGAPLARAMLVAAEKIDAARLHAAGGVHRLGTPDDAIAWAFELAQLAPLTVLAHKIALAPGDRRADFDAARTLAWSSRDAEEGRLAFLEKRQPRFTGA